MASKILKWTLDMVTGELICKHKPDSMKQVFVLADFYQSILFSDLEEVEKCALAYAIQQKLSDCVAGKGSKAGYSGAETLALLRNRWDELCKDRVWSKKGSGGGISVQKKLREMKVISQSMANAAPMLGLKVDPAAVILSDEDYQKYLDEQK